MNEATGAKAVWFWISGPAPRQLRVGLGLAQPSTLCGSNPCQAQSCLLYLCSCLDFLVLLLVTVIFLGFPINATFEKS